MLLTIFITLIIFTTYDYLKTKKIVTPVFIFNAICLITLGLYQLKLSYLQQDLSNNTIFIFLMSILAYNVGCLLFGLFKYKKMNYIPKIILRMEIDKKVKIARYIVIFIFLLEVIYSGGIPFIWKLTGNNKIYFDYGISSIHGAFNGLVICLGAYSLWKKPKDSILYFVIGILILSRQVIMSIIIEATICIFINKKNKINYKKGLKYLIIILALFTIIGNFRSGNDTMNNVFNAKEQYVKTPTTIKWVYSYMTFSISNFNNLVSITNGNINKGTTILNELIPTVILNKANIEMKYNPYYLVSPNYTVSTYLPVIYLDYGLTGIILFNFFLSFLGCSLFYKLRKDEENNISRSLSYSVFAHNIILLFFTNMFLYLPVIIQFIYIPLILSDEKGGEEI